MPDHSVVAFADDRQFYSDLCSRLATAPVTGLNRRTLHSSETAEDTAITWFWFEQCPADGTIIKMNAGVRRHLFNLLVAALRAS